MASPPGQPDLPDPGRAVTVKRRTIEVTSQNCTGCQLCKLACSHVKTEAFSLSRARIKIDRLDYSEQYQVSFTPQCDSCGFCVSYCCFDAIRRGRARGLAGATGSQ